MQNSSTLFVGNLSYGFSFSELEQALFDLFSEFGEVKAVTVLRPRKDDRFANDPSKHRGIAFVEMVSEEAAGQAKDQLTDYMFGPEEDDTGSRARPLKIDFARPKNED